MTRRPRLQPAMLVRTPVPVRTTHDSPSPQPGPTRPIRFRYTDWASI